MTAMFTAPVVYKRECVMLLVFFFFSFENTRKKIVCKTYRIQEKKMLITRYASEPSHAVRIKQGFAWM